VRSDHRVERVLHGGYTHMHEYRILLSRVGVTRNVSGPSTPNLKQV